MEVTLEDPVNPATPYTSPCFNPYSNGSYSGSVPRCGRRLRNFRVSILILMEVTLEVFCLGFDNPQKRAFQSLF